MDIKWEYIKSGYEMRLNRKWKKNRIDKKWMQNENRYEIGTKTNK